MKYNVNHYQIDGEEGVFWLSSFLGFLNELIIC